MKRPWVPPKFVQEALGHLPLVEDGQHPQKRFYRSVTPFIVHVKAFPVRDDIFLDSLPLISFTGLERIATPCHTMTRASTLPIRGK